MIKRITGLTLVDEREGEGRAAQKGDHVVYSIRFFLNRGDEVLLNSLQAKSLPQGMIRIEDGVSLIDHRIVLGRRQAIAGVE
jgi:hypothetical protein